MKYGLHTIFCWMLMYSVSAQNLQLTFTGSQPSCNGGSNGYITVNASGGNGAYSYAWSNNQSGQTAFNLTAGTYTVTVTTQGGQSGTGSFTLGQPLVLSTAIQPGGFSCTPVGTLTAQAAGGTSPYSYSWSNNGTGAVQNVNVPGFYYLTVTDANQCTAVASYYVIPALFLDVLATNVLCPNAPNTGSVTAAIAGGTTPYTYIWSNNANTQTQQNIPAGVYTVTVTDAHGCSIVDAATVGTPAPIQVFVNINAPACGGNNGSVSLQATGGTAPYTFNWPSLGATGAMMNNLAAGTYTVIVTDANNCQQQTTVTVPQASGLQVQIITTKAECPGVSDGTAFAQVFPPGGNYQYTWNPPQGGNFPQINNLAAGTQVWVTVTDPATGCMGTATNVIATHNFLSLTVTDVDIPCLGQSLGSATAVAGQGTAPYNYDWFNGPTQIGTGSTINNLQVGAYLVSVTDNRGCTAIGTAEITAESGPVAAFSSLVTSCTDSLIGVQFTNNSADPYNTLVSWHWEIVPIGGSGSWIFNQANIPVLEFQNQQQVIVSLTVTSANGCTDTVIDTVKITGAPEYLLNLSNPGLDCNNTPANVQVLGDQSYTYTWVPNTGITFNPNVRNVIINPNVTTTYQLIVSNGLCVDTSGAFTIQRVVPINLTVDTNSIITCLKDYTLHAHINPASSAQVTWYTNMSNSPVGTGLSLTVPASGVVTYFAVAIDSIGCSDTASIRLAGYSAEIEINGSNNITACAGEAIQLGVSNLHPADVLQYVWTGPAGVVFSPSANVADPLVSLPAGTYTVTVTATNQHNCTATKTVTITQSAAIDLSASSTNVIACDSFITLTATANAAAGAAVIWYENGQQVGTGLTLQVNTSGTHTYTAIAINALGCSDTLSIQVTGQTADVQIQGGTSYTACAGEGIPVAVLNLDPNDILTYQWSGPSGVVITPANGANPVITGSAGTYTVTVTATNQFNCSATKTITVQFFPAINLSAVSTNIIACDSSIMLTATANATSGVTITWYKNGQQVGTGPTLQVNTAGSHTYTAVGVNAIGCSDTLSIQVTGQTADVQIQGGNTYSACAGESIPVAILNLDPNDILTYQWSGPSGITITPANGANPVITGSAGTYTITVTATNQYNCSTTKTITVQFSPAIDLSALSTNIIACDTLITLTANANAAAGATIKWYQNGVQVGTGPTLQVNTAGTHIYTAIAVNALGCSDTLSIQVTGQTADVQIQGGTSYTACAGAGIPVAILNLDPNDILTYQWSGPAGVTIAPANGANPVITGPAGTYSVTVTATNQYNCTATRVISVQFAPDINLAVLSNNIITCEATMNLSATANVGAGVTVTWFKDGVQIGTGLSVSIQTAGTHTFTAVAVNALGCTDTVSVQVTGQSADVQIDASSALTACENTPIQLNVLNLDPVDQLQYQWTAPAGVTLSSNTSANPTVTGSAGSYTLTVTATNQFNCTATLTVTVVFNPAQSIENQIKADLCNGLIVQFTNTSGLSGVWNFGDGSSPSNATNPTHTYTNAGPYLVTFTPANAVCILPFDSLIQVQAVPALTAAFTASLQNCVGDAQVQFSDNTQHANPIQGWSWTFTNGTPASSNQTNPLVLFANSGTYTAAVTVTDINGCTATASLPVQVDVIDESLSEIMKICPNESIALNPQFSQDYTYTWSSAPNDPDLAVNNPNPTVSPETTTVYKVLVTNGLCVAEFSATVEVKPGASVDIEDMPSVVCSDDPLAIYIAATNATNLIWDNESTFSQPNLGTGTSITVNPVPNGVYYVLADFDGCKAIDSIKINNAAVDIQLTAADEAVCAGVSTTLSVNNQHPDQTLTYVWSPNLGVGPDVTITPQQNTTYSVTATYLGCTATASVSVSVLNLSVDASVTGETILLPNETTGFLAIVVTNGSNVAYSWFPTTGLNDPFSPNPTLTFQTGLDSVLYCVSATTEGKCPDTACVKVTFREDICEEPYIFVPNSFSPNGDSNNDRFMVRAAEITEVHLIVWSRWGEKVFETRDINDLGWDGTFKGNALTPDSYAWYLKVRCGNGDEFETKGDVTLLK